MRKPEQRAVRDLTYLIYMLSYQDNLDSFRY